MKSNGWRVRVLKGDKTSGTFEGLGSFRHGGRIGNLGFEKMKMETLKRRGFTIYLADNEDGWWRTIITNANQRDITRCDIFEPEHLPSSDIEAVSGGRRIARARHRSGCNVMYLDWHAGYMEADDMTAEMWRF